MNITIVDQKFSTPNVILVLFVVLYIYPLAGRDLYIVFISYRHSTHTDECRNLNGMLRLDFWNRVRQKNVTSDSNENTCWHNKGRRCIFRFDDVVSYEGLMTLQIRVTASGLTTLAVGASKHKFTPLYLANLIYYWKYQVCDQKEPWIDFPTKGCIVKSILSQIVKKIIITKGLFNQTVVVKSLLFTF